MHRMRYQSLSLIWGSAPEACKEEALLVRGELQKEPELAAEWYIVFLDGWMEVMQRIW